MSTKALSALLLSLGTLALAGCSVDESLSPVSTAPTGTALVDAGPDAPAPLPEAGPWKRSILTRNPIGGPSGNLLIDGDFEHSTVGQPGPQTGWRAFSADGSALLPVKTETGGLCRTGLRCAVLEPKSLQLLRGTAARDTGVIASIWARLPPGSTSCKAVSPILIRMDDFATFTKLAGDKAPDAAGDCHYGARIPEKTDALGIYIENTLETGTFALLDSAVLAPDDGTVQPKAAEFWPPPPDLAERLLTVREAIARSAPPPRKLPVAATP
jgi:hypothetical protein